MGGLNRSWLHACNLLFARGMYRLSPDTAACEGQFFSPKERHSILPDLNASQSSHCKCQDGESRHRYDRDSSLQHSDHYRPPWLRLFYIINSDKLLTIRQHWAPKIWREPITPILKLVYERYAWYCRRPACQSFIKYIILYTCIYLT